MTILLLDCDAVLSDFFAGVARVCMEETGLDLRTEDFSGEWSFTREIEDVLRRKGDLQPAMSASKIRTRILQRGFCANLPPLPGARESLASLQEMVEVIVVTSPMEHASHWRQERVEWLRREMGLPDEAVILCERKDLIFGDLFVDDKPTNVRRWRDRWGSGTRAVTPALLWDTPFNRRNTSDMRRVMGWSDLLQVVESRCAPGK